MEYYRYECEHCNTTFDVYSGSYDAVTHCPFCGSTLITDNDAEQLISYRQYCHRT